MDQTARHISVWNNCLRIIEQIIEPQKFDTWFRPIIPVAMEESTLTVEVPSDFFREFLEGSFLHIIKPTLKRVIGADAKLVYVTKPAKRSELKFPASPNLTPTNRPVSINTYGTSDNPGAIVFPGLHKVSINPHLNPVYCFEHLVKGECNKMGITAAINISSAPGRTPYNPLFLFGGPGLGKTHIAQAIGNEIHNNNPELVVLYVTGNEFKTQYMDATTVRNKLTDFLAFYMKIDVLIVDDIQDLLGQGSQGAFFNIFNHLHQNGKQLIFTSDRAPVDLQNFEDRLLSRFKWGLSVSLGKPDYETRLNMLRSRCTREGMVVPDNVLEFLANRIRSNFRELEGALVSILAYATMAHEQITVELAESITGNIISKEKQELTIDMVQDIVCEYFNLTRDDLLSKTRKRQIVQARQIAMYLCRNLISNCSLSTIGSEIGGKDHATVLHACSTVSDLISTDRVFKQYVTDIEKMLAPVIA